MVPSQDGTYDYVQAIVRDDGIELRYQVTGAHAPGKSFISEPWLSRMPSEDIQMVAAGYLGVLKEGESQVVVSFQRQRGLEPVVSES